MTYARKHVWRRIVDIHRVRVNRGFRNIFELECGHVLSRIGYQRIPANNAAKCPECTEQLRAGVLADFLIRPATGARVTQ